MYCSWQDFYSVNNKKFQIEISNCDKNIPTIVTLTPKQSKKAQIRLLISKTIDATKLKFKIGFNLMKVKSNINKLEFDYQEQWNKKNIIWSNEISM